MVIRRIDILKEISQYIEIHVLNVFFKTCKMQLSYTLTVVLCSFCIWVIKTIRPQV